MKDDIKPLYIFSADLTEKYPALSEMFLKALLNSCLSKECEAELDKIDLKRPYTSFKELNLSDKDKATFLLNIFSQFLVLTFSDRLHFGDLPTVWAKFLKENNLPSDYVFNLDILQQKSDPEDADYCYEDDRYSGTAHDYLEAVKKEKE